MAVWVHIMRRYSNHADHLLMSLDRCFPSNPVRVERPGRPGARLLADKLSQADQLTIVQAYQSGDVTLAALAAQFGVSDYSIRKVLRGAGVQPKRASVPRATMEEIHSSWDAGLSVLKIVQRTGVPEASVRLILAGRSRHAR